MKKILGIIVVLALVALGVYIYMQYEESQEEEKGTFIKPRLEYSAVNIYYLGSDSAKAKVHLLIDNPMPLGLDIDSFSYDFYIKEKKVFTSTYPDSINLEAGDSSQLSIPLTIYRDSLQRVQQQTGEKGGEIDSVTYTIDADFYTNLPLLEEKEFNISYDFKAPLFRSPSFSVTDWSYEGLEGGNVVVNLQLQVINYNLQDIEYKDIDYQFILGEDESVLSGHRPGKILVEKRDTGYVTLPIQLDVDDAGRALWDYITEGDDLNYRFNATVTQVSESDMLDESPVEINATGNIETLKEAVLP